MTGEWFEDWVELHCQATAADARARAAILALGEFARGAWAATPEELGEVTARFCRESRIPKFAADHANAVGLELVRVREERRAASVPPPAAPPGDFPADCPACGGSGIAVIPLRSELAWAADHLGRRVASLPAGRAARTGGVLCDRPGCAAGVRVRQLEACRKDVTFDRRRPALSRCEGAAGGADLPGLLRAHEHALAVRCRGGGPGSLAENPQMAAVVALALRRLTGRRNAA